MLTLTRPAPGEPTSNVLPMPLLGLERAGARLRRSEVSMIAGQPGAGKSALALHLAVAIGAPALYIAADTDRSTMRLRAGAMLTGRSQHEVEAAGLEDDALSAAGHVLFAFDPSPDVASVRLEADACDEVFGEYPHLIVVDNLTDCVEGGDNEWSALRQAVKGLKVLARDTGAAVLALHHVQETSHFTRAPSRSSIQGKISQLPALILTVDSPPDTGVLTVGVVKNRHGPAAANGSLAVSLGFDPARMQISDLGGRW